jgi:hypothetical protein
MKYIDADKLRAWGEKKASKPFAKLPIKVVTLDDILSYLSANEVDVEVVRDGIGYGLDNNEIEIKNNLDIWLDSDINIDNIEAIYIVKKKTEDGALNSCSSNKE